MIASILSLAFSIHSNKGVYALLLGSGVSRSAGIPTGWEVTLDLIRKLAHMQGENCEPNPAKWYEEKFLEDADYSKLLKFIAKTSSERTKLLKPYFEPTEEERQQNIKTSTLAHKAIATLVAKGFIKVILTTNFDRLMEKALEDVGIIPTVISTKDAIDGATPIIHTTCTIIKLHGDYLDNRIKNTPEELSIYDRKLNGLLDRIFDEFGLIICGWSGEWDIALRHAIQRCSNHRYTTYWAARDELAEKAKKLSELRKAEIISIQSADTFFDDLSEKLLAISEFDRPHPISAKIAVVTFKRYLEDEKYRIRLHDLVSQETERLIEGVVQKNFSNQHPRPDQTELIQRMKHYEAQTEILQAIMVTGGYWGNQYVAELTVRCLERLADLKKNNDGYTAWINLQLYPALLLLYSSGLAALTAGNYLMLASLLLKPQNKNGRNGKEPLLLSIIPGAVIEQGVGRLLPDMDRRWTPTSDYLVEFLADSLKEYIPEQNELEEKCDRLEYLISLSILDYHLQASGYSWTPIGRFGWRFRHYGDNIASQIQTELNTEKENWKLLKAGFFGGSIDRANAAQTQLIEQLKQTPWF